MREQYQRCPVVRIVGHTIMYHDGRPESQLVRLIHRLNDQMAIRMCSFLCWSCKRSHVWCLPRQHGG